MIEPIQVISDDQAACYFAHFRFKLEKIVRGYKKALTPLRLELGTPLDTVVRPRQGNQNVMVVDRGNRQHVTIVILIDHDVIDLKCVTLVEQIRFWPLCRSHILASNG